MVRKNIRGAKSITGAKRTTGGRRVKKNKTMKMKGTKNIYKQIIACFMNMLVTVKLYHWKTTSYSTHKATDQLYTDLNEKIDEFVEVMLGKPDMTKDRNYILDMDTINLHKYNNNTDFKKEVEYYKNFIISLSESKEFNSSFTNIDLLAIRDEILALFNQFLYLLSLEN